MVRETYHGKSFCNKIYSIDNPEARIQIYGSMATGLAIDSSDMDLLISGVFGEN